MCLCRFSLEYVGQPFLITPRVFEIGPPSKTCCGLGPGCHSWPIVLVVSSVNPDLKPNSIPWIPSLSMLCSCYSSKKIKIKSYLCSSPDLL